MTKNILFFILFFLFSFTSTSQAPQDHLILYYDFNGNAQDKSGNKYHGVVVGASLCKGVDGQKKSAYKFTKPKQYIKINGTQRISFPIAISVFVKYYDINDGGVILSLNGLCTFGVYQNSIYVGVNRSNQGLGLRNARNHIKINEWQHWYILYKSAEIIELYLDNKKIETYAINGYLLPTSSNIGNKNDGKVNNYSQTFDFKGEIDELKIFKQPLSTTELRRESTVPKPKRPKPSTSSKNQSKKQPNYLLLIITIVLLINTIYVLYKIWQIKNKRYKSNEEYTKLDKKYQKLQKEYEQLSEKHKDLEEEYKKLNLTSSFKQTDAKFTNITDVKEEKINLKKITKIQNAIKCLSDSDYAGYFEVMRNIKMSKNSNTALEKIKAEFIGGHYKNDPDFTQRLLVFTNKLTET